MFRTVPKESFSNTDKYNAKNQPVIVRDFLEMTFYIKIFKKNQYLLSMSSCKKNCFINNKKSTDYQKVFKTITQANKITL